MTKLYFHAALETVLTNLPTTEQSTLTANDNWDAQKVNRTMDTTIGTAQTSLTNASLALATLQNYYVTKFISKKLNQTSISANTWNYKFAAQESNANANFPCTGTAQVVYVNCYVWRTSNGTKVGTILDGNTVNNFEEASTSETIIEGTFSGSAVSSITVDDDVIVFEVWFRITQAMGTSYTQTFYYDGTTESSITNNAAHIETPQTISFITPAVPVDCTVTGKTITNKKITHG